MTFKENDKLWYVNPYVYELEHVTIKIYDPNEHSWIDDDGAYLHEDDLFDNLEDAKVQCVKYLNEFYSLKIGEILKQG